jgi:probable HAF family extracellular repeat protein
MGDGDRCYAEAINDAGQIAGGADIERGGDSHAFIYENGTFFDLGTAYFNGEASSAIGINRLGHVAVLSEDDVFLWKDGQMIDLGAGTPFSRLYARSINDHDELVGDAVGAAGRWQAVLFKGGRVIVLESAVDALLDWQLTAAFAINNRGLIVGQGFRTGDQRGHFFMLVPLP